ncbi:2-oxo acid dehydrogenase subunit E2 [Dactylosporangium sp. NPDC049742]|uniref:2-oxo acid dehydrogenase subunit E2 n=1 Tax=Dactylosporangium sp. NPDC049742 TaxID=3154737 RepID=UPI00343DD4B0
MTEIRVPQLNANDVTYTLVEWLVEPGGPVAAGDPVATVETSKAAEELPSPADGVVQHLLAAGAECAVGAVIGRVAPALPAHTAAAATVQDEQIITEPARRLIAERGIDPALVRALDTRVVRTADLAALLPPDPVASSAPAGAQALPPVQQAVVAVVTESHRSIPAAFVAVKVHLDNAIRRGQLLTREHKRMIGMPELLIAAIGAQLARHPGCFGAFEPPHHVRPAATADVGVTMDVGRGLHVPVVRDAAAAGIREIAERLMALRMTALRGTFRAGDLTGATIMLALHTDDDVTVAVPIVQPGTVCALSLAGRTTELDLDDAGTVVRRTVVQLGVAYDHRVVNGREAVELLRDLRDALQQPPEGAAV